MCSFDGVKEDEEKSGWYSADHSKCEAFFRGSQHKNELKTG